jgi:hypothetical protein
MKAVQSRVPIKEVKQGPATARKHNGASQRWARTSCRGSRRAKTIAKKARPETAIPIGPLARNAKVARE